LKLPVETVFLLDIDNTLIDHDELKREVTRWLEQNVPHAGANPFWEHYESVREELDIVHFLEAARRYGHGIGDPATGEALRSFLWDYPFTNLLLPATLEACAHLATIGKLAVLCDGESEFQHRKLGRIGLLEVLAKVFVFDHKEKHFDEVAAHFPGAHFVLFDDKPRILTAAKAHFGHNLSAVHVRHGRYAIESGPLPGVDSVANLGEALALFPVAGR